MLNKLLGPFREFGPAGAIYGLDRVLRRIHPHLGLVMYDLMAQPITDKPLLPAGLARNLSFRELAADSSEVAAMAARPEIKAQRFAQGATALGVFRKDTLLGYVWFCTGRYVEDEVRCVYVMQHPEVAVFDFDLVVVPESRMGLGFAALWHCANQYLTARGVRTSYSRVTRFNVASRLAHQRLGARRFGTALFLQVASVEVMLASVQPYVSFSVGPSTQPQLVLDAAAVP
jgi:hypothetical protein